MTREGLEHPLEHLHGPQCLSRRPARLEHPREIGHRDATNREPVATWDDFESRLLVGRQLPRAVNCETRAEGMRYLREKLGHISSPLHADLREQDIAVAHLEALDLEPGINAPAADLEPLSIEPKVLDFRPHVCEFGGLRDHLATHLAEAEQTGCEQPVMTIEPLDEKRRFGVPDVDGDRFGRRDLAQDQLHRSRPVEPGGIVRARAVVVVEVAKAAGDALDRGQWVRELIGEAAVARLRHEIPSQELLVAVPASDDAALDVLEVAPEIEEPVRPPAVAEVLPAR